MVRIFVCEQFWYRPYSNFWGLEIYFWTKYNDAKKSVHIPERTTRCLQKQFSVCFTRFPLSSVCTSKVGADDWTPISSLWRELLIRLHTACVRNRIQACEIELLLNVLVLYLAYCWLDFGEIVPSQLSSLDLSYRNSILTES